MYICNERPMYISQIAVFTYSTELFVLDSNTWNHLTVQTNSFLIVLK